VNGSGVKLCECGCGQQTTIITKNDTKQGYIKGNYFKFLNGHNRKGLSKLPNMKGKKFIPEQTLRYNRAKTAANTRNCIWTLTEEEYTSIIKQPCIYGGSPLLSVKGTALDQKIPGLGYTLENSLPCCCKHNVMKGIYLTYDHMLFLMKEFPELRQCSMRGLELSGEQE